MTYFYYKTNTWGNSDQQVSEETRQTWEFFAKKKNWRIVQLPNGYYQTECQSLTSDNKPSGEWTDITRRETIEAAEAAIDSSIEHYTKRLDYAKGPKVVKTFK